MSSKISVWVIYYIPKEKAQINCKKYLSNDPYKLKYNCAKIIQMKNDNNISK